MLAYVLALVIGLGSFAFYLAAFFFPEVHRKSDFYLSGGGLFYALVLWVCAGRITGWVLLSQIASVALLCWLGWQTLTLRRVLTSPEQQTPIPTQEQLVPKFQGVLKPITSLLGNLSGKTKPASKPVLVIRRGTTPKQEAVPEEVQETTETEVPVEEIPTVESSPETVAETAPEPEIPTEEIPTVESSPETVVETAPEPEILTEEIPTVESSPETVAETAPEPEIPTEEMPTVEPSPETVMEAPESTTAPATSPEKPKPNLSSGKKQQGLVQKVTGLFKGFLGKSKAATPIPQKQEDRVVSSTTETSMDAEPDSVTGGDTLTPEITEALEQTVPEIQSETPVVEETEISEAAETITVEFYEVDTSETSEPVAPELSTTDILETSEPIAAESPSADTSDSLEPIPPKPPTPELLEDEENLSSSDPAKSDNQATTKIEEIAPEVELAPPAEPVGDGDPEMRANPPESPVALEGVPLDPENPPKQG